VTRKALVVGINHYTHGATLFGCVDDAHAVKGVLERHSDGSVNFAVKLLTGTGPNDTVRRSELKESIRALFADDNEIALFYFAAELTEGLTILTASTAEQYATEENTGGVFTSLFIDALNGPAGNLVGDVTPGSVYAQIDQSLGPWEQRPVFKTNVKSFVSLRKVQPPITLLELQRITEFFPSAGFEFKLDPTFEPELKGRDPGMPPPDPRNTSRFAVLQKYNRVNLVSPVGAPHMWHAAMQSKSCKLTVLGEHYRRLRAKGRI
jgi:hypothetical protein